MSLNTMLRRPAVCTATGLSASSIHRRILQGLFPRPVRLGERSVGWPLAEVEAINAARIAGRADVDICELVGRLHMARNPDGMTANAPAVRTVRKPALVQSLPCKAGGA